MSERYTGIMASKKTDYPHGSTVRVKLFDGRMVEAKVCYMEETSAGRKVTIAYGSCINRVDSSQIVEVIRGRKGR
jgi:hypothetical protein